MDAAQYVHPYVPADYMFYWMFYGTNHSDTESPQNVHADKFYVDRASLYNLVNKSCTKPVSFTRVHTDVPSEYLWPRMFFYTNYSDMEATQNVHVDVHSGYFWYWEIYYTHHRDMYIPQYVSHVKKKRKKKE